MTTLRLFSSPELLTMMRQELPMVQLLLHQFQPLRCLSQIHLQLFSRQLETSSAHKGRYRTGC